jgi:hypothetical protein
MQTKYLVAAALAAMVGFLAARSMAYGPPADVIPSHGNYCGAWGMSDGGVEVGCSGYFCAPDTSVPHLTCPIVLTGNWSTVTLVPLTDGGNPVYTDGGEVLLPDGGLTDAGTYVDAGSCTETPNVGPYVLQQTDAGPCAAGAAVVLRADGGLGC